MKFEVRFATAIALVLGTLSSVGAQNRPAKGDSGSDETCYAASFDEAHGPVRNVFLFSSPARRLRANPSRVRHLYQDDFEPTTCDIADHGAIFVQLIPMQLASALILPRFGRP